MASAHRRASLPARRFPTPFGRRQPQTKPADAGDQDAASELARLLARRGDLGQLRACAEAGDVAAADQLARLLIWRWDLDELRARADAGDTAAANHMVHGEDHWNHKLTWPVVHLIRTSHEPVKVLAARYRVVPATISAVRSWRTWRSPPVTP